MFVKWWKFATKNKTFGTWLTFILNFQKNWIRFMMISNIELKWFQIDLMLELFICWRLKLLELFLKNYSLGITFHFFKIFVLIFWQVFLFGCLHFFLNLHYFFHFFPNKNCQAKNSKPKKHVGLGKGGLIQLFKPKILPN